MLIKRYPQLSVAAISWEKASNVPMALLGLIYLGVYSIQVIYRTYGELVSGLEIVSLVIWGAFALDVSFRLLA